MYIDKIVAQHFCRLAVQLCVYVAAGGGGGGGGGRGMGGLSLGGGINGVSMSTFGAGTYYCIVLAPAGAWGPVLTLGTLAPKAFSLSAQVLHVHLAT